jgi:hypothetical protein
MYIEATGLLVTADVTPLVANNVDDLLQLLAGEFYDDFQEIATAEPTGQHDGHAPERLAFESLAALLLDRMQTKCALTGQQAVGTGERMARAGRERSVPSQQVRRAS